MVPRDVMVAHTRCVLPLRRHTEFNANGEAKYVSSLAAYPNPGSQVRDDVCDDDVLLTETR